jgi:hypothetical protein
LARRLNGAEPALVGRPLYEKVAKEKLGCDDTEARAVVLQAERDFAQWPVSRAVTLRDLVSHLVIVRGADGQVGDTAPILQIVERIVPADL